MEKKEAQYLTVTPRGALFATSTTEESKTKEVLMKLLNMKVSPKLTQESLLELTELHDEKLAEAVLYQLQVRHFVQAESEPVGVPDINIHKELPTLLRLLSSSGKTLLIDSNGFQISSTGFAPEDIEQLAVVSSEFSTIFSTYKHFLSQSLNKEYAATAVVNNQGISKLGFVMLDVSGVVFTLTIGDTPFLNQRTFRDIVWLLTYRYGNSVV